MGTPPPEDVARAQQAGFDDRLYTWALFLAVAPPVGSHGCDQFLEVARLAVASMPPLTAHALTTMTGMADSVGSLCC